MTVATDTIKGTYLVEGQAQKEARSNEWFDQLALNLAGYLSKDVAGAGTVTLTDTVGGEAHHATLRFTGALTGDRTVIVPSAERVYFAGNLTTGAFTLTVTTADGSGALIPQASWLILVCDGVNVTAPAFTSGAASVPPASETVAGIVELATPSEVNAGTDAARAITPATLQGRLTTLPASEAQAGLIELATQDEVNTGTDALRAITPVTLNTRLTSSGTSSRTGVWRWITTTSGAPASGQVGVNQTDYALVTEVRLHEVTINGTNASQPLASYVAGDLLDLQEQDDATRRARYQLSAPGTDQGLYFTFPVTFVNQGTQPLVNNQDTVVTFSSTVPLPIASETVAGIVELATSAETTTGTDATRATHPAGIKAALDAKVPSGTPLSVVRYASSGTALEASALTSDPTTGNLGLRTTTPGAGLHIVGETTTLVSTVLLENASNGINAGSLQSNKMRGTLASPARVQAGDRLNSLTGFGYVRNAADSADALTFLAGLRLVVDVLDAQARGAGRLTVDLSSGASATPSEVLRVTSAGNLLLGTMAAGTALAKGVVVGSGSAPSGSHPADAVQLWVADRAGVAGKAALHLRTEDGTSHVLGDLSGIATLGAATLGSGASYQALTVAGSLLTVGASSVQERAQALLSSTWVTSTDATRTARLALSAYDATAAREGLRVEADGTAARLGFFGSAAVAKPTVTGSRGGNAALASALTALASLGLMTDSSTA